MKKDNINFIFFGTPDVASETLEILKQAGFLPSLIVTAPDRPAGRKMLLTPPPVKAWAIANNIPYIQPENLKIKTEIVFTTSSQAGEPRKAISQQGNMRESKNNFRFDFAIVVAYGKILSEEILKAPRLGSINIHYSLLPKYRGASPVESAILNGDTETGVSIQQMELKMDTGPILAQEKVAIMPDEKAPELRKRLIKLGGELLVKTLPDFIEGKITQTPQDESLSTYCKKMTKEDGLVNLEVEPPSALYNKFRAYATWPRTYFFKDGLPAQAGKRIIITDAVLENNQFIIKKVIPEGGKERTYSEL
ncbi:methionyl-tRNA formyltransferase [Candidatus Nomurabacteria bacterium RIFCSPLOWO2_01_FULL_41_21]|uniref:Methionyl-tRNA formyltransferase n=2 Tax=Candidatus Nomuraibacteriota TaxID=1752729 RepID=A0A1F6V3D9_9BACT|nr:MAG: methionyl-tRNA formyltransferase [Candidatus Nomurabacteria bacterium RIFCSPHIGHO2_01_FULL_40_20]OGI88826.1 MAG: methionyl-tRNA formyltransferase [Candidatus Nomurabacteria bacterium RIFCSPLOWO2_01_FULL_41_21]